MIEFLTSDPGIAMLGAASGFVFRQFAQWQMQSHAFDMEALRARSDSMNAAAERVPAGSGGTWTRRLIFGFVAAMFLFLMVAAWNQIPVAVETIRQKGMLFWKRDVTEIVSVQGYFFPTELRQSLLYIITFVFGQGVKGK